MSLFEELRRRNVFRVGIAYALMGWVLLQGADFVLDLIGVPDWVIRALTVVVLIGLPIALFFAWAFELTPEGLKRESEVDRDASVTRRTGRSLDRFIIAVLVLVVGWFLLDDFYLKPRHEPQMATVAGTQEQAPARSAASADVTPPGLAPLTPHAEPTGGEVQASVAVLPFRAMSSGPDDEFFADGLTEEILNSLAQVPDLSVTSRTSAFFFKDKDLPIQDIALQLGVDNVVEGSVRRSGDRLRVTVQLIRTSDDTHLWSENYDSTDEDAIAVQEDIAQQIAETLGVFLDERTLALMRSAGLRDVTAFIEYQKGRALHERAHGSEEMMPLLEEGNEYLERALAIQPNFTPAWLFYSDYYTHLLVDHTTREGDRVLSEDEIEAAYRAGRTAFMRAARGATNPNTRAASELDLAIYEGNAGAWRPLLEEVLSADSCETIIWHQLVGFVPDYALRFAQAMERFRACDPMTNRYGGMILSSYLWAGDPQRAFDFIEMTDLEEHSFEVAWKIRVLTALGEFEEASNVALIDSEDDRSRRLVQVLIAAAQGDAATARRISDAQAESGADNRWLELQRAAWLGDRERANELAAAMDAEPLGHLALMMTAYWCACGAPFDLEAAPRFAEVWQAADFPWPLASPIDLPLKDW